MHAGLPSLHRRANSVIVDNTVGLFSIATISSLDPPEDFSKVGLYAGMVIFALLASLTFI